MPRAPPTFRHSAAPGRGMFPSPSHRRSTSAGSPWRSAPSANVTTSPRSTSGSGVPCLGTSAIHGSGASSKGAVGTRKTAPIDARSALGPVDAERPWRVRERRDLGEEFRLDRLACDEQLDRLDARLPRRRDEVLALGDEEAELLAPAPVGELANELELLVLPR